MTDVQRMTIDEGAEFLKVNHPVIQALIDADHLATYPFTSEAEVAYCVLRKSDLLEHIGRWGSASDAGAIAGITRKGMETRARQNRAVYLKAPEGTTFKVNGQTGLSNLFDLTQVSPTTSKRKGKEQATNRGSRIRPHYRSDLVSGDEVIRCDKELDITMFHTKGVCSKKTTIRIEWDNDEGQPTINIRTRVPVTVNMSAR